MAKKRINIFLEEEEIMEIDRIVFEVKQNGYNITRSEWIRVSVINTLNERKGRKEKKEKGD